MVFIAELFWWFEIVKPEFVQPRERQEIRDGKRCLRLSYTLVMSIAVCCGLMVIVPRL